MQPDASGHLLGQQIAWLSWNHKMYYHFNKSLSLEFEIE
jgi:hypothetical protein